MVLRPEDLQKVKEILSPIERDVEILFFRSNEPTCMYCDIIEELLKDISSANEKVKYTVYKIEENKDIAEKYGVKHGPTILFKEKPGIIYMGIPSGYELMAFLEDIKLLGTGKMEIDLPEDIKHTIEEIDVPLDIYVFVTPQCPYCPFAVKSAHRLAYLNPNIRGLMIEAMEYNALADKYMVSGVPKNVVVDRETGETLLEWEGSPPDILQSLNMFTHYVYHAALHKKGVPHEH